MLIIRLRREDQPEERLEFAKPEISLGRDAGNDVALSDGSVSKFHAELARVGSAVVLTDLKSTNGTLVNGNPISVPVKVGENDEIAIGGATIHIDRATFMAAMSAEHARPIPRTAPTGPLPLPSPTIAPMPTGAPLPTGATMPPGAPLPLPPVPGPPRQRTRVPSAPPNADTVDISSPVFRPQPHPGQKADTAPPTALPPSSLEDSDAFTPAKPNAAPTTTLPLGAVAVTLAEEMCAHVARLVARVGKTLDLDAFDRAAPPSAELAAKLDEVLAVEARSLVLTTTVVNRVVQAARDELVGTGPLGSWLADRSVTKIACFRPSQIELTRSDAAHGGSGASFQATDPSPLGTDIGYSSDAALRRAVVRLARQAGERVRPGERVVERRLEGGARLVAILPPGRDRSDPASTAGPPAVVAIAKTTVARATFNDLADHHGLSDPMASLLARAMGGRANILVCGEPAPSVLEIVAALAESAPAAHRVAILHRDVLVDRSPRGNLGTTWSFPLPDGDEALDDAIAGAIALRSEHTFVVSPETRAAASALVAIGQGAEGIIVTNRATTADRALVGLAAGLSLARPGIALDAVSAILGGLDLVIEVGPLDTASHGAGVRPRVRRIAEVAPVKEADSPLGLLLRDLFVQTPEASGSGSFAAKSTPSRLRLGGLP